MKRRHFIRAATASLLIPVALESLSLHALSALSAYDDYAFFDERFENARRIAATWCGSNGPVAVQGDITQLWSAGLNRATRDRRLQLRGVTTESFRFCLGVLVSEHAEFDLKVSRLDRYLFLWTMQTAPRLRAERRNG
ncbi:MAG: hypothetical protein ACJ8R9_01100 [Steroidobacteraceae bacterium]